MFYDARDGPQKLSSDWTTWKIQCRLYIVKEQKGNKPCEWATQVDHSTTPMAQCTPGKSLVSKDLSAETCRAVFHLGEHNVRCFWITIEVVLRCGIFDVAHACSSNVTCCSV